MRRCTDTLRALLTVVALGVGIAACGSDAADDLADHQAAVAEAGVEVMPFDLDETTHIFTNSPSGGRQDVIADDPSDATTISLIRTHLADEAAKFSRGDFSDPEAIHGPDMPGLSTLRERFADFDIELIDTDEGATIVYSTQDDDLVDAIHLWFAAQSSDHGNHAEHNM